VTSPEQTQDKLRIGGGVLDFYFLAVVQVILNKGAEVNAEEKSATVLRVADPRGHTEVVNVLSRAGTS